ncbi:MAG: hypothetical protein JO236_08365 [Mycobacterium sp.]|uniref:hypothetical protein n=1 Tax=Mycobacterium sp. TaxID=1785 RepID=UPI001EB6DDF0|nr:hypothetical protein [Mycobacterium sp.]MBW0017541.1 hypothetical protein [Mycobacterium sp.]
MDVALGVAIEGEVGRLALIEPAGAGSGVIDQSVIELGENPVGILTETVAGTNQLLAGENHRLVATRLCWSDEVKVDELRRALEDSGVQNVQALSESEAATALLGPAARDTRVLLVSDENATLLAPAVDDPDAPPTVLAAGPAVGADATATLDTMMARLGGEVGGAGDIYLVDTSSEATTNIADQLRSEQTMRVEVAEDPTFALARGAALAAGAAAASLGLAGAASAGDFTALAPAVPAGDATGLIPPDELHTGAQQEPQLAYSESGDYQLLPLEGSDDYGLAGAEFDDFGEFDDDEAVTGPVRLSSRSVLIKNAVIAFAVLGFSTLAVAVAVTVRPTAASVPVQGHQNAQPGKFMPLLPTQQQAPVPAPPADEPTLGFQGGTVPAVQTPVPQQVSPGGIPEVPVPTPAAPGVPVPIPVPFPGWQPGQPTETVPTYTTPTTTPPTTTPPTTTPPTTTAPTTTPPTTTPPTTQQTTQATTPPTTQAVTPTTQPTTAAPPTTHTNPPTQQTTAAPQPTYTQQIPTQTAAPKPATPQQPANPQPTHGGHH